MIFRFSAVILTGLAAIGPFSHLFSLPNKMALSKSDYFVAQRVYDGWWLAGILFPLALLANVVHGVTARDDRVALTLAFAAAACIAVELVIFYFFTQPANAATNNWTTQPDNWEVLRYQWEYSHAVNAGVMLLAFGLATWAALRSN